MDAQMTAPSDKNDEALAAELRGAAERNRSIGRDNTAALLDKAAEALQANHYANIEHDTLGCHVAKTGIYAQSSTRPIEAEVGKYPMNGHELLATLRGIADDEDRGVDKDRRRGAVWAVRHCISAVEAWLRGQPIAVSATVPKAREVELLAALREATSIGIANMIAYVGTPDELSPHKKRSYDRLNELHAMADSLDEKAPADEGTKT
jgi:hypothetical protein